MLLAYLGYLGISYRACREQTTRDKHLIANSTIFSLDWVSDLYRKQ